MNSSGVQAGDWPTIASAALLFLALVFAAWQVWEARTLRHDQTRPFVTVDYKFDGIIIMLEITNLGSTAAHNVRFEFDPPLVSALERDPPIAELALFRSGIPWLPPGKIIDTVYDQWEMRHNAQLPDQHTVTINYEGPSGRRYDDDPSVTLDLAVYRGLIHLDRRGIHDVHTQLKKIAREISSWSPGGVSGLLVSTPEDVRRRDAEFRQLMKERKAKRSEAADAATSSPPTDE